MAFLKRLRAEDKLTKLRAQYLALRHDETHLLFSRQLKSNLTESDIEA